MSWGQLLRQEILIRIPENDIGFVYVVKYGGVTVWRGFVSTTDEERARHTKHFAWRAAEIESAQGDESDAG